MAFDRQIRELRKIMSRFGETVKIIVGDNKFLTKAFVQRYNRNFRHKYGGDDVIDRLGVNGDEPDYVAFVACDSGTLYETWDNSEVPVGFEWRGEKYTVLADSVLMIGDEPLYFWALIRRVREPDSDYYDEVL